MKKGTVIKLPNGKVGTVVYHNLDGYGIRWGILPRQEWDAEPEAMLRDEYPSADLECVGEDYEVVNEAR